MHRIILSALLTTGLTMELAAAQFAFTGDINGSLDHAVAGPYGASTYSGTSGAAGFVGDGGYDSFDGYGYLTNLGSFTVQRQVDFIAASNTYRWLDVFTNPTAATVTRTIRFFGDLGSDGATTTVLSQPGLLVTRDGGSNGNSWNNTDPVISHISGSTSFTDGSLNAFRVGDDYFLDITLTLDPGEAAGILNFAALTRTAGSRNATTFANDVSLAQITGQNILANPILTGLTWAQITSIRNFATPEPTTWAMLFLGLACLVWTWRKRTLLAH